MIVPQPHCHARILLALTAEAGLAGLVAIKLVVGEFARVRPPPRLGGEAAQPARPAAVGGFVAVGMQAGVEIGNRTPRADEGGFRKALESWTEGTRPSQSVWMTMQ